MSCSSAARLSQRRCSAVNSNLLGDQVGEQRDALAVAAGVGALGVDHLGEGGRDVVEIVLVDRRAALRRLQGEDRLAASRRERSMSQNSGRAATRSKAADQLRIEPGAGAVPDFGLAPPRRRSRSGTRRSPAPAARCAHRPESPSPLRPSGWPPPSQCSSRFWMPWATGSEKRIWRAMSAPRWQRVSISSRAISPPFMEDVDERAEPLGQARPSGRYATSTKRSACGRLPSIDLEVVLEGEIVGQIQLADARRVAAAAEILQQQRVIELGDLGVAEADFPADVTPIQQQRTQCPAGWPSAMSSAWLSAPSSSESVILSSCPEASVGTMVETPNNHGRRRCRVASAKPQQITRGLTGCDFSGAHAQVKKCASHRARCQLDAHKMSGVPPELSRYPGPAGAAWWPQPRLEVGHERQYFQ